MGGGIERYLKSQTYSAALQKARTERATLESLIQVRSRPGPIDSASRSPGLTPQLGGSSATRATVFAKFVRLATRCAMPYRFDP